MYLVPRGGVPGPGGCTWSWGVYLVPGVNLVLGGVPGPRGVYLVWGVPGPGGVPGPRGCTWSQGGVPGPRGVYLVRYSPPVNRMTNRCKNITLPQTSFAGGKYVKPRPKAKIFTFRLRNYIPSEVRLYILKF